MPPIIKEMERVLVDDAARVKAQEMSIRIGDAIQKALVEEGSDQVPLEPIAMALASLCGAFVGAIPEDERSNVLRYILQILMDKAGVTNANLAVRTHTGDKLDS